MSLTKNVWPKKKKKNCWTELRDPFGDNVLKNPARLTCLFLNYEFCSGTFFVEVIFGLACCPLKADVIVALSSRVAH